MIRFNLLISGLRLAWPALLPFLGTPANDGCWLHGLAGDVKVLYAAPGNEMLIAEQKDMARRWIVSSAVQAGQPHIVSVKYSDADVAVVSYNAAAAPYLADPTGQADATVAIQRAIDDCAKALGGVVYLPEGYYRIEGGVELRTGVTLRGDWAQPTAEDKTVRGTVLNLYHTQGKGVDSEALEVESPILLANSTGIRDLSIFYPEQSVAAPVAYPYTIRCKGKMQTVMNVTLVNAYRGIRYEPDEGSIGHPNVRQVYGSPLRKGLRLSKAAAVPRIQDLHFTPDYWVESGLPGSPSRTAFLQASRALGSVGLEIAQSDNGILGNLELSGYDVGLLIGAGDQSSNMKCYDFRIMNCRVGVQARQYKVQGWNLSKGVIQVDGEGAVAVEQTGGEALMFHSCAFASDGQMIVSASGGLGFIKCHFQMWGQGHGIDKTGGRLIAYGNTFDQALGAGQAHICLSSNVSQAVIARNVFHPTAGRILTPGSNPREVVVDLAPSAALYEPNYPSYTLVDYFKPARGNRDSLFNVQDYGAMGDCETDNTAAFQAALDAAGHYGGGTIYVPGGAYRIDGSLVVPSGVELRGVHDLPHYTGDSRSIMLSYVDLNHPGETVLVSLSAHSGIRGFLIVRPQQKYNVHTNDTTILDLPFVIRALGNGTSIVNIAIANADKGIDLAYAAGGGIVSAGTSAHPWGSA